MFIVESKISITREMGEMIILFCKYDFVSFVLRRRADKTPRIMTASFTSSEYITIKNKTITTLLWSCNYGLVAVFYNFCPARMLQRKHAAQQLAYGGSGT